DGIRYLIVTGVQTCALPISLVRRLEHEVDISEPNRGPRDERCLPFDLISIDERPIGGVEVHQYPYAFATLELRMGGRDRFIGQHQIVVIGPPDRKSTRLNSSHDQSSYA